MGRQKMDTENKEIDELIQNYEEMDETGKEKLKEMAGQLKKIWETKMTKKMTNQEINMWSILIAVLKNKDKNSYEIKEIIDDIYDIKNFIKTL